MTLSLKSVMVATMGEGIYETVLYYAEEKAMNGPDAPENVAAQTAIDYGNNWNVSPADRRLIGMYALIAETEVDRRLLAETL